MSDSARVAIVHEKFTIHAGSERVVEQMHLLWPNAPIFCAVCDPATLSPILRSADIRPSHLLQRLYRGGDRYAHLLPLLPAVAAHRRLRDFDVVVTSHHQFANRVRADAPILSYTHTPARWIWDPNTRLDEIGGPLGRAALGAFAKTQQRADYEAAQRLSAIAANSSEVSTRIRQWWERNSTVIHPPVDTDFFTPSTDAREDFFLLAGRLVPYKRPEIAVAAAVRAGVRLVVVGDGRARAACEAVANDQVEFVGIADDATLRDYYRRCRALLYPGREDFGIMPVEAQACGAPVIALGVGGALDTVIDGTTGCLYEPGGDEIETLAHNIRSLSSAQFDATAIAAHAQQFGPSRFRAELKSFVDTALDNG